jgi:hypothetical protein
VYSALVLVVSGASTEQVLSVKVKHSSDCVERIHFF